MKATNSEKKYNRWILILSITIPLVVAILFGVNLRKLGFAIQPLDFLPPIYASINALTALVLILALWAVKKKKLVLHKNLMKFAIFCSILFLMGYVAYHMTSDSTPFGGQGWIRYLYFSVLISHIFLSILVIPLVLVTYVRTLQERFDQHKKIAKITFPIWLYVAISGVVVYYMIAPYYV